MTIEEHFREYLISSGMFPSDTAAILESCKNDSVLFLGMEHRWHDDTSGYPAQLLARLRITINRKALEYIDAQCPEHEAPDK